MLVVHCTLPLHSTNSFNPQLRNPLNLFISTRTVLCTLWHGASKISKMCLSLKLRELFIYLYLSGHLTLFLSEIKLFFYIYLSGGT